MDQRVDQQLSLTPGESVQKRKKDSIADCSDEDRPNYNSTGPRPDVPIANCVNHLPYLSLVWATSTVLWTKRTKLEPKKVRNLLSTLFCVVHRHFCALLRACSHGLTHLLSGCSGVIERFFCSVGALHNDGLCPMIHFDNRSLGDFDTIFADFADFQARFLGAFPRLVNHYFRSFLKPIKPLFRSLVTGLARNFNRVFCPIRRLHSDRLRRVIHLCYRSMDHAHDILCDAEKYCRCKTHCKTSEMSHCNFLSPEDRTSAPAPSFVERARNSE